MSNYDAKPDIHYTDTMNDDYLCVLCVTALMKLLPVALTYNYAPVPMALGIMTVYDKVEHYLSFSQYTD
jgi:hypothetical protein